MDQSSIITAGPIPTSRSINSWPESLGRPNGGSRLFGMSNTDPAVNNPWGDYAVHSGKYFKCDLEELKRLLYYTTELLKVSSDRDISAATSNIQSVISEQLWIEAKDFKDLCWLGQKHLEGFVPKAPNNFNDYRPRFPDRLELSDLGILFSGGGQLKKMKKDLLLEQSPEACSSKIKSDRWQQIQERPWMTFYVANKETAFEIPYYNNLFRGLQKETLVVSAIRIYQNKVLPGSCIAGEWSQEFRSTCRSKTASSEAELESKSWEYLELIGNRSDFSSIDEFDEFEKYHMMRESNAVLFEVVSKDWDEDVDIVKLVQKVARACDFKPRKLRLFG